MPTYFYRAVDLDSQKTVEGAIEAQDDREARSALRARGILPLSLGQPEATGPVVGSWGARVIQALTFRPVRPGALAIFVRQLSAMLEAGLPLVEGLVLLEANTGDATLRATIAEVRQDLLSGKTLSEAMARFPAVFPPIMIHLVHVGELSGDLDVMLTRLADMLEKSLELERKVRAALTYPVLVSLVLFGVVVVILAFVVPSFAQIFAKAHASLPMPTLLLMGLSKTVRDWWALWALLILGGVATYKWYRQTPVGRGVVDRFWLRVPGVGPLLLDQSANTFARAFGTVYGAGVPITQALESCRRVVANQAVADLLERAESQVLAGNPLSASLQNTPYFPAVLAQMMAIGETSGRLEDLTAKAVIFSDREIEYKVKQLTTMIEPLLVIVMGFVIMGIALALYLPMFDLPKMMMRQ